RPRCAGVGAHARAHRRVSPRNAGRSRALVSSVLGSHARHRYPDRGILPRACRTDATSHRRHGRGRGPGHRTTGRCQGVRRRRFNMLKREVGCKPIMSRCVVGQVAVPMIIAMIIAVGGAFASVLEKIDERQARMIATATDDYDRELLVPQIAESTFPHQETTMPHFTKRPVVVEAMQYTDRDTGLRIVEWTRGSSTPTFLADPVPSDGPHLGMTLRVRTLESGGGSHVVEPGDWVIRGVNGEHYPCKPEIFEKTYTRTCAGTVDGEHEPGCAVPDGPPKGPLSNERPF